MIEEIQCIRCETVFDAIQWEDGKCPCCGDKYTWDAQTIENEDGTSEDWEFPVFDFQRNLEKINKTIEDCSDYFKQIDDKLS